MDWEKRSLQAGAAALCCAILLRLWSGGLGVQALEKVNMERIAQVLLLAETGRRLYPMEPPKPEETQPPETVPQETEAPQVRFSPADAALVEVRNACDYELDVQAMLETPLSWDLRQQEPTVLIYHTHATESYEKTEDYQEIVPYRTEDENYSVIAVGQRVADILEGKGISVIHDKTLHDLESYNASYDRSRTTLENYLAQYPTIRLALDIHRDAAEDKNGNQVVHTVTVDGQESANLMLVVGTDASGLNHPNWRENIALAVKLQAELESAAPGICRPVSFRRQRFNQDLSPGALLVEVGTAGNTLDQALQAAQVLGDGIAELASGSTWTEELS